MTEKQIKDLVEQVRVLFEYADDKSIYKLFRDIYAESRKAGREEGIDEMRDAIVRTTPTIRKEWVWTEAEQLKEQG